MQVLVVWGTRMGGTEGIARSIGEVLQRYGFEVVLKSGSDAPSIGAYDAVIVGGALYANRWHRDARRFVTRNVALLRHVPVWLFSSGPLDESADHTEIPPTRQVAVLMERIGAQGHATFGGRIPSDAKGFPAAAMAKTMSGDWRNFERIRAWAVEIARELPNARPRAAVEPPGRSLGRLLIHGIAGWAICAAAMGGLLRVFSTGFAIGLHAVLAPLIFLAISAHYFRIRGAREPLPTAFIFTATVALLDLGVVAGLVLRSASMFTSITGTWLPLGLIFVTTWITGALMSTMPWPKADVEIHPRKRNGGHDSHARAGA